jgi:hypothetical protein
LSTPIVIGLLVVIFGAVIWAFVPPAGARKTTIRLPGFEISLDVPALAVMAIGVAFVAAGIRPPSPPLPSPDPPPSPDPLERCSLTGTYYVNDKVKGTVTCGGGGPYFCKLNNGLQRADATLVPSPTDIHGWTIPDWNSTARERKSCTEIEFSPSKTIWKRLDHP